MNRFYVTVTYSYDVPDDILARDYDTTDLRDAAAIDQENLRNYSYLLGEEVAIADNAWIYVRADKVADKTEEENGSAL
jgi:hypothetical protein